MFSLCVSIISILIAIGYGIIMAEEWNRASPKGRLNVEMHYFERYYLIFLGFIGLVTALIGLKKKFSAVAILLSIFSMLATLSNFYIWF